MKSFVHTIDSLNTLNIQLTEENTQVKKQITQAKKENLPEIENIENTKPIYVLQTNINEYTKDSIKIKKGQTFQVINTQVLTDNI